MSTPLQTAIAALRRALVLLERAGAQDGRALEQQVVDCVADAGPLSTNAVARLIARRRSDVLGTIKLLEAAGRIERQPRGWVVRDEA